VVRAVAVAIGPAVDRVDRAAIAVAPRAVIAADRRASSSSAPTVSRCPSSRVAIAPIAAIAATAATAVTADRVPLARRASRARLARRSRHSLALARMASRCRPGRAASASRSAPMPTASDPMELLGIPSAARSVRPSVRPSVPRRTAR
jgi:hypothetical protein